MRRNRHAGGLPQLFSFLAWILRLWLEKWVIGMDARLGLWKIRYSLLAWIQDANRGTAIGSRATAGRVTFVLPVDRNAGRLRVTLRSLRSLANQGWECILCVEDPQRIRRSLQALGSDDRFRVIPMHTVGSDDRTTKTALAASHGQWIVFARTGDRFAPRLVDRILEQQADILFWDEDLYTAGWFHHPFFKPDWAPETWFSVDLLRASAFKASFLKKIGKRIRDEVLRPACILKAGQVRHLREVLSHHPAEAWRDEGVAARHAAEVHEYLHLQGNPRIAVHASSTGAARLSLARMPGLVSIIIPTRDNLDCLRRCIDTILAADEKARYEIVLVDNQSEDQATRAYYRSLLERSRNIRVVQYGPGFNYSAACNLGARAAKGEYLLFLNNDVEVTTPGWISNLLVLACLKDVGVVGARLTYPDGRIQHAGIVIGLEGHASHLWMGTRERGFELCGSPSWYRNYSAVTGACMMTSRAVFRALKGFDEGFELVFGDVDYCLRAGVKGYRTVYTPDVTLIHHEGQTRGRRNPETDIRLATTRFQPILAAGDPYYHPALSNASRLPTLRTYWEQDPIDRVEHIVKYNWY